MKKMKALILSGLLIIGVFNSGSAADQFKKTSTSSDLDKSASASNTYKGASIKPGVMLVKVKAEFRNSCSSVGVQNSTLAEALRKIQSTEIAQKFPRSNTSSTEFNRHGKKTTDLGLMYSLNYDQNIPVGKAVSILMSTGILEYAEPAYIHYFDYFPNDPSVGSQYFLGKISAYDAWDITKGDTNVVIGIVDSGTDWDHPDLQSNIKYNWNDPIDGLDNDSDGFIDNFRGWDVSGNDNNPMNGVSNHGSHVSGCAAAVTDNGVGVAGPSFYCKFLPVKSSLDASATTIDDGYDGIVYAVDHGADIINCSWGRSGAPSQFEQDIVNYATLDNDKLIVAAAGNSGMDQLHYPSSYKYVTSVAWTNSSDSKNSSSNFGYSVDVCAPGTNIYTTVINDSYTSLSGTSMASPIAAGCAAMIKSKFPSLNALQIGEQLRVTCDNIYGASGNTAFQYKLGKGRVNLFNAVTDSVSKGVILDELITSDRNDEVFVPGDTIDIIGLFQNLLRPTQNLNCNLISTSPFITILNNTFNAGVLNTLDTMSNFNNPYRVVVSGSAPLNTEVLFRINMVDGVWSDFYSFKITVNVDYINIAVNDVSTSITSKSVTGYNDNLQSQGLGFTYLGSPSILYEMGLMIGAIGTQVSDNVRSTSGNQDEDFTSFMNVTGQEPGPISAFDANGSFSDQASPSPLHILVTHRAFAWTTQPDRKYVMVDYLIKNMGLSALNGMYAGLCADWDVPLYGNNKASVDYSRRLGYVWSTDAGGLYGGMKLLSRTGGFSHYAIDNVAGGGGANLSDGFSDTEKYEVMSTLRPNAGNTTGTGNDVIDVVSSGPFNLAVGDSVTVAFALIGGESLSMIQESADAAQAKYDSLFVGLEPIALGTTNSLEQNFPNPAMGITRIYFTLKEGGNTKLVLVDDLGKEVKVLVDEKLASGKYSSVFDVKDLPAGIYHYNLRSGLYYNSLSLTVVH